MNISLHLTSEFITWCDYLGTFAFAISGIRLAAAKRFDWFGAYVVGLITAIGGGTIRDLFLNQVPFWLTQSSYFVVTALALVFTILFRHQLVRLNHTFFTFDAIGLGLFVVVGVNITLSHHYPWWVAITMGTITGSFGGLIRDILIGELPLIFRKDIYATACLVGAAIYVLLAYFTTINIAVIQSISAVSIVLIRMFSAYFHISIPTFKTEDEVAK